ncbi:RHS repeat-associated core domain-containing protein [Bacteroides uniformis]|nr:RHS repeat-associated core domain-containing protein [Bacteroides uniformis]
MLSKYKYDNRNRCNWKKLPGASAVSYVYDEADNMIFSQDGKQYASKQWSFYLYDKFHRLAVQGVCSNTNTAAVSNVIVSCTRVNSNSGLGNSGYTSSFALVSPEVHRVNYYDDYAFRSLTGFDNAGFPAATIDAKGYVTGSVITVLGSSTKLYSANYYDFEGRITKTVQGNLLEGYDTTNTVYTFTGKPNTVTHTHTASGKTTRTEVYTYTYDHADRISKVRHSLGGTSITLYDATYDNFGRLLTKQYHGTSTNKLTYAYNLRSWLTGISGTCFTQNLYYNTGVGTAKYNGSISSMTWKSGNESTVRGYKFTYDGLDRVLNATYGETASISTNANRFSENVTGYDKNGNIKSLQRYGQTGASAYGLIDNLTFTLNGNQLSRVDDAVMASAYGGGFEFKDGVKQVGEYTYDANGNLTKDLNKGITDIQYNCLNLPSAVTFSDGSTITYVYAADGTKLRTVHKIGGATTTTDYCGNVVYENGAQKLLITEEGYITLSDNKYYYYLKDHQGNNRVVINQSGAVEETNHYYLFGGVFASSTSTQPYKYNSKEYDTKKGLNWYDYGARHYDAVLGRFMTVDPLAEKYYSESLYTYCYSNPINCIDPNGKDGIYIAFPDYKISTPIGKIGNLGHAGVLLIDNKTGVTKYYEYGRYDKEGKGVVRTFAVPNVKIGQDKKPTLESLNKTLSIISEQAGHAGRIEGAYIESDKFKEMKNYAESKIAENANSKRKEYSLRNNNCGTFAADVLKQDPSVKDKAPVIIDPRPNSIVKEYQDNFKSLNYDPKKRQVKIE